MGYCPKCGLCINKLILIEEPDANLYDKDDGYIKKHDIYLFKCPKCASKITYDRTIANLILSADSKLESKVLSKNHKEVNK